MPFSRWSAGWEGSGRGLEPHAAQTIGPVPTAIALHDPHPTLRHPCVGQHDQVVGEHAQPDRAPEMLKSPIKAAGQAKSPF